MSSNHICDPFWENLPKYTETTIEIYLKVGSNFILNKYLKHIFSYSPIIALPLYEASKQLVAIGL